VKPNTPKVGDLESSGTPECLEFNSKAQNTLHWGVLEVIGKVLKRRYRKWPRIGHLDICSSSYGQKEGSGVKLAVWLPATKSRESTHSRRALGECDTSLERSRRGLQYWFILRPDPRSGRGVMAVQSPGSPTGTHSGQLRDSISGVPGKSDIRMPLPRVNAEYTIGSKVVAYSRVRAVVCLVVQSARGLSPHPRVSRKCELTTLWFVWCRFKLDLLKLLPSLIPRLSTRPSTSF
jgi:hypothetical protein